ncbi:MAG TPA: PilZ domain-containing protein [Vicinamibacterales bacterium]|jgi:hypothetical protein|nr:PilZ domain-containing protein [Vicinamibacterales bacterium]
MERRRHPRVAQPLDGTWQGGSGAGRCRIADLSLSGCFVHSLSTPAAGDVTLVTIAHGDTRLTLRGRVVYVERTIGFGVQFQEMTTDDEATLGALLQSLQAGTRT